MRENRFILVAFSSTYIGLQNNQ